MIRSEDFEVRLEGGDTKENRGGNEHKNEEKRKKKKNFFFQKTVLFCLFKITRDFRSLLD